MNATGHVPATLTGQAIGDALGMPFELLPNGHDHLRTWKGGFVSGRNSPFTRDLNPGQWTDDTKMAVQLAQSLRHEQTYSPVDASRRYLAWFHSGDLRGIGKMTRQALTRLDMNLPWTQSGGVGAEGNGTAMRVAPIGLFFRHNIQAAGEMAVIDARITHNSLEAATGSMAVALGVAALLQGATPEDLAHRIVDLLPPSRVRDGLVDIDMLDLGSDHREDALARKIADMGVSAHVVQTVPAAFAAFAATRNFHDAVRVAILAGGDTDTTAAITGALAGTYYGASQVEPFMAQLEDADVLRELEVTLYEDAPEPRPV